jgi:hypothetical protein
LEVKEKTTPVPPEFAEWRNSDGEHPATPDEHSPADLHRSPKAAQGERRPAALARAKNRLRQASCFSLCKNILPER